MAILKRVLVVLLFLFLGGILAFLGGKQTAIGFVGLLLIAGAGFVGLVLRRYPLATGVGSPQAIPSIAHPYRTAIPTDAATAQTWQPGAVPRGVITDRTMRFLGSTAAWRSARVSVSNLRGGQHIQLAGAGHAMIRLAPTPRDPQLHILNLTHAETRQLLGLFAQHDFLTITFPARPLAPDGSATTLTLRNADGQEFTLTRHDYDLDEGGRFVAIAAPLLALTERLDTDQPRTEVALTLDDAVDRP